MGAGHQENEIPADAFQEDGLDLSVTEFLNIDFTERAAVALTDLFGQLLRACAGENFSGWVHG